MKKLLYILLALPLFFASCSDDDNDLPDFRVKVDISGQSEVTENGVIVIPSGNQFSIDAISIVESDAKEIAIGGVSYYWDYILLDASNIIPPYGITFNTTGIPEGCLLYTSFQKVGANVGNVVLSIDRAIASEPKVSGGEPYLSRTSNDVLQKSLDIAKKQGDQYVTLEAILLAIFTVKSLSLIHI